MRIKEVEELVGITRKNIRFYEAEGLLHPERNSENGYRDYTEENVEMLKKIKLLRKLSVPIEEIRRLQIGSLTLADSMERHIVTLKRQEENVIKLQQICRWIKEDGIRMPDDFADAYLEKMKDMESEGIRFMNVKSRDKKKKLYAPVVAGVAVIVFFLLLLGVFIWGYIVDTPPLVVIVLTAGIPVLAIIGTILALIERVKEIEGGEEDEAAKY
ncbi:MAG: MerR family transcriptional regulator [Bacteroidales bacterium]|nr:MerR family transcriptional regulator [Clostridium sp.]MCM1203349.1 MerR family transcriptional regulator [Bacteroidales bacterium]